MQLRKTGMAGVGLALLLASQALWIPPAAGQSPRRSPVSLLESKQAAGQAECGTDAARAQQERFLHLRHAVSRARRLQENPGSRQATALGETSGQQFGAPNSASPSAGASLARGAIREDVGEIAILEASDGVVGARNVFNLGSKSLTLTPGSGGYSAGPVGGNTYDAAAAAAGVKLELTDDQTRRIPLPFPFPFYGAQYREAWVSSNGLVSFTRGDDDASGTFGHFTSGPPAIAALFTDLDPEASNFGVRVLAEAGRIVISWDGVPLVGFSGLDQSVQLRLFPDGRIEMAWGIANPITAVVGITPGGFQDVSLVDFASGPEGEFAGGVAEAFASRQELDLQFAAQRFYESHDDAYDYLVFYNATGLEIGSGIVAFEMTTRSSGKGYGDTPVETGASFGSARRLQAVLNMGPVEQYPVNPFGLVSGRGEDTPLSLLAHEAGHLFLALVSVPNPVSPFLSPPMLGAGFAHWAFPFNSDASFLEGNRIEDTGAGVSPRFRTTEAVSRYSALDRYLMGLIPPEEVPPTFAVTNPVPFQSNSRLPRTDVTFNGSRLDITVDDVIAAAGRRTPDATVAQREFRMAFVLIVEDGEDLSAGSTAANAVAQIDEYRRQFEPYFGEATGGIAAVQTELDRVVDLSLAPAGGVLVGRDGSASIGIEEAVNEPLTFALSAPKGVLSVPPVVTIPAGATRVAFAVTGNRVGVEDLSATASGPPGAEFMTARARVQVGEASGLRIEVVRGDAQDAVSPGELEEPVVARVVDANDLPYAGLGLSVEASGGGVVEPASAVTDERGRAEFRWSTNGGSFSGLRFVLDESPGVVGTATALGRPAILSGGVVHTASYAASIVPGGFGSIFGGSLAAGAVASAGLDLAGNFPLSLGGVQVRVNGAAARLAYVSDAQINFIVPPGLPAGPGEVVVETRLGVSESVQAQVSGVTPGIFFDAASGYGAVLIAGTASVTQVRAGRPGEFLEVYMTGLGGRSDAAATIAGVPVRVTYAGKTVVPGLDQVNVALPEAGVLPPGRQELVVVVGGVESNRVFVELGQ